MSDKEMHMACHMVKRVFLAVIFAASSIYCGQAGEPIAVIVSAERAAQIAMNQVRDGEIVQQKLRSRKRGSESYEILIVGEENRTNIIIDANTGEVLKSVTKPINRTQRQRSGSAEGGQAKISHEQANEIAKEALGGVVVDSKMVNRERSGVVYEVGVLKDGKRGIVRIDADTGEVMRVGEQYSGHKGKKKIRRWQGGEEDDEGDAPQAVQPPRGGDRGKEDDRGGDDDDNDGDEDGDVGSDVGDDGDGIENIG